MCILPCTSSCPGDMKCTNSRCVFVRN
jgi:hypothetical protein